MSLIDMSLGHIDQATMSTHFIFIVGMEKCGTTALANWLVNQQLAQYMVPDVKEPHLFSRPDIRPSLPAAAALPWLDASTSYAHNPHAIAQLPAHNSKIVLCLRNPLQRAWSAYRMKKLLAQQGEGAAQLARDFYSITDPKLVEGMDAQSAYQLQKQAFLQFFPRKSAPHVAQYFDAEIARLRQGSFAERVQYETAFHFSRGGYPFLPVLAMSFYYQALRQLLDKYLPEDIIVLSLHTLQDADNRAHFLHRLLNDQARQKASAAIPLTFSTEHYEFDEAKPDFAAAEWQSLRQTFAYDLTQTAALLQAQNIDTRLLDWQELGRDLPL